MLLSNHTISTIRGPGGRGHIKDHLPLTYIPSLPFPSLTLRTLDGVRGIEKEVLIRILHSARESLFQGWASGGRARARRSMVEGWKTSLWLDCFGDEVDYIYTLPYIHTRTHPPCSSHVFFLVSLGIFFRSCSGGEA